MELPSPAANVGISPINHNKTHSAFFSFSKLLNAIPLAQNTYPEAISPTAFISCLATVQVKVSEHP